MDYKAFYADVAEWINLANQTAAKVGMKNEQFWTWVTLSAGDLCKKYQDNRIVIKQMMMLIDWLEEIYESMNHRDERVKMG